MRVFGLGSFFCDRQSPPEKPLGLVMFPLRAVDLCQAIKTVGNVGMLGPQGLLLNNQQPLVEWLGLFVLALSVVELRQLVETGCQTRVLRP